MATKKKNFYSGKITRIETIEGKQLEIEVGKGYIKKFADCYLYKDGTKEKVIPDRLVRKVWRYK